MHVACGAPSQRTKEGDPVPCYAAVAEYTLVDGAGVHLGTRYDYCGCEALVHAAEMLA